MNVRYPWTSTPDGNVHRFELRCAACCAGDAHRGSRLVLHASIVDGRPNYDLDARADGWRLVGDKPACSEGCAGSLRATADPHYMTGDEVERRARERGQTPLSMGIPGESANQRSVGHVCRHCGAKLQVHQRRNADGWSPTVEEILTASGWPDPHYCGTTCRERHAREAPAVQPAVVPVLAIDDASYQASRAAARAPKGLEDREVRGPAPTVRKAGPR